VRIRRLLGAALTVPVLVGGLLLVTAVPAAACSCPVESEAQQAARADAVFVGTLVSSRVDPSVLTREYRQREEQRIKELKERFGQSAVVARVPDPVVLTFEVSRVYKGAVRKRQEIVSPMSNDTCGSRKFAGRGPFLVLAWRPSPDASRQLQLKPGQYGSGMHICNRSRALADGGEPSLGRLSDEAGWPDSFVGVGALAAAVAAGLGLAALRARRRATAD
jgi:hypothetical protein